MSEYESPAKAGLSVFYLELGLRIIPTASDNSSGNCDIESVPSRLVA